MLPVVGALLFMIPLLWSPQHTPETDTATGGLFLFVVWGALIISAFLLSRRLRQAPDLPPDDEDG